MFFSVSDLELRKIQFDTSFAPGQIDWQEERLRQSGKLEAAGSVELVNSLGEIRVRGRLQGQFAGECDRCLEPIIAPAAALFDLLYEPDRVVDAGAEVEIVESDTSVAFYQGDGVELADIVREQVLLSLPLQWLCRPECKGLCAVCGQNKNENDCQCRAAQTDERWAALKDITTGD